VRSTLPPAARGLAALIALLAAVDPAVPVPRWERPVVRIAAKYPADGTRVAGAVVAAGFTIDPAQRETIAIVVTDRIAATPPAAARTWVLDSSPPPPNVRVSSATTAAVRLPGQAVDVHVVVDAAGMAGKDSELILEDGGLRVAAARHRWAADRERWEADLEYLPPVASVGRLRVRAVPAAVEKVEGDNLADVAAPRVRGPLRVLVIEAAVTWPAMFVRRALEGEGAFAVSALQRATRMLATTAGAPPITLTRESLKPYEVAVVGGLDQLRASDVEALRWFVESRGGLLVLVPDRAPAPRYAAMTAVPGFESRVLDVPIAVGPDLLASELATPKTLPRDASVLAADPQGQPVVFALRRGAGGIIFSGALDAWRHRGGEAEPFARFWRRVVAASALLVPPAIEIRAEPALARPGDRITVTARIRESEFDPAGAVLDIPGVEAHVVGPETHTDTPLRLWPTAEPGVFAGDWPAGAAGAYDVSVNAMGRHADARVDVAADVVQPSPPASESLALFAQASGGRAFPADRPEDLSAALAEAYPPARVVRRVHPMRSPWWCLPFAALLCAEWILRRRRGLA
jgi:hypothetical protein